MGKQKGEFQEYNPRKNGNKQGPYYYPFFPEVIYTVRYRNRESDNIKKMGNRKSRLRER
jgi:hypothetical protein